MESRGMGIIAVCQSAADRHHLAKIKKFWQPDPAGPPLRSIPKYVRLRGPVQEENDLETATQRLLNDPEEYILVTLGYPENEIRSFFKGIRAPLQVAGRSLKPPRPGNDKDGRTEVIRPPSASLLGDSTSIPSIIFGSDPIAALRKATIRHWIRQNTKVRLLEEADLDAYFSLRYQVWHSLDYIPEARICEKSEWEVDYTDRSSIPIGGFLRDKDTGRERLVACGRLVRGVGDEEPRYREMIEHQVKAKSEQKDEPRLQENYEYPDERRQPFDILDSFPGFREYYANLVQQRIKRAETSRIIVEKDHRRQGIGEVIVDSLIDLARGKSIRMLFLACVARHCNFYERCGFSVVPHLACDKFVNVNVPAIAMHRELLRS